MTWAIGVTEKLVEKPEFQVIRYNDMDEATMALAQLMAMHGPYTLEEMKVCIDYLLELDKLTEEDFDGFGLYHCALFEYTFFVGKFEVFADNKENDAPYKVVQDHRDCTPNHCFGNIAERN